MAEPDEFDRKFCFKLQPRTAAQRTYVFQATSEEDLLAWIQVHPRVRPLSGLVTNSRSFVVLCVHLNPMQALRGASAVAVAFASSEADVTAAGAGSTTATAPRPRSPASAPSPTPSAPPVSAAAPAPAPGQGRKIWQQRLDDALAADGNAACADCMAAAGKGCRRRPTPTWPCSSRGATRPLCQEATAGSRWRAALPCAPHARPCTARPLRRGPMCSRLQPSPAARSTSWSALSLLLRVPLGPRPAHMCYPMGCRAA